MEQIEVQFFIKNRMSPIQIIVFDSKEAAKQFLLHLYDKEVIILNDIVIATSEFRYAKIRTI